MFDTANTDNQNLLETEANIESTNSAYGLETTQNSSGVGYIEGTLGADYFTIDPNYQVNVISGNGNIDYAYGGYDVIDLSNISTQQIVNYSFADTSQGGILFDTGNGERVFDYIALADGTEILFEGMDGVVFSDQTIDLTINTNDTFFAGQWNLHMMGVHNAWRLTTGTDDVLIGVQDTGLGVDNYGNVHEDIRVDETLYINDNIADEFYREAGQDSHPQNNSHGNSVQGIIAAEANNGVGIAGINWESDVFNIDVLDNNTGDLTPAEATQRMIDQANSQGQNLVINMSYGINEFGNLAPEFSNLEQLIANNPNTLFVIAAGNDGHLGQEGLASPAVLAQSYDNVIAVGASWGYYNVNSEPTTPGTRIEYEGGWGSQYGAGLTLMGPSEVYTTDADVNLGFNYNPVFNGTSAAAPNVTGVASLVWSANSDLTASEVKQILSETAYDLGQEGYDIYHGHGFVNADAAVRRAIALGRNTTPNLNNNIIEIISSNPSPSFSTVAQEDAPLQPSTNYSDRLLSDTDSQANFLEIPESQLPTSLFDYDAAGMKDIVELNGQMIKDDLFSSPLYAA